MPTDTITLQIVKNAGAPATGAIAAAFSDSIVLKLASSSGVRKVKYRIYEFPDGFPLPSGWTQEAVNTYSVTIQNGGDAPAFTLPASGNDLRGKYFFDAVANDQKVNGAVVGGLRSKAAAQIPMSTAGLEDAGYLETNEFDTVRQWMRAIKKAIRVLDQAVLSGGGVTDHGALTGLADDDHAQYEFARRPLTAAYTAASNDAALADARSCIITTRATAISLRIRLQATIVWLSETLLGGINTGAGTLTITAEGGVTLNGSVTVPQNGWWWAKRTAANTWQIFTGGTGGGGGGTGDFKADGTVPMTGDLDFDGNKGINLDTAVDPDDAVPLSQAQALIASAIAGAGGGGGDGFAFTFDTATTDADHGNGKLAFDNTNFVSITKIYIDNQDASANNITGWVNRLDDTIGTVKGYIRVGSRSDATKWLLFRLIAVTNGSGYDKLTVDPVTGAGPLTTTAADTFLSFEAIGFTGTVPASSGGTGIAGAGGTPNRVLRTSDGSTWNAALLALTTDVTGVLPPANGGSAPGVSGGNLTNASVTKNITDGTDFTLPASTLAASAKTLTFGTSGSPKIGEQIRAFVFAQSQNYTVQNGGSLSSSFLVTAGEAWVVIGEWMGTDWLVQPLLRLA